MLPPNVETTLTLNASGTYFFGTDIQRKAEWERLRGTFQVLDGNILILVHPSSGDNIFYKVRDAKHIILLDSFRNEPKGMNARLYVLVKNKY